MYVSRALHGRRAVEEFKRNLAITDEYVNFAAYEGLGGYYEILLNGPVDREPGAGACCIKDIVSKITGLEDTTSLQWDINQITDVAVTSTGIRTTLAMWLVEEAGRAGGNLDNVEGYQLYSEGAGENWMSHLIMQLGTEPQSGTYTERLLMKVDLTLLDQDAISYRTWPLAAQNLGMAYRVSSASFTARCYEAGWRGLFHRNLFPVHMPDLHGWGICHTVRDFVNTIFKTLVFDPSVMNVANTETPLQATVFYNAPSQHVYKGTDAGLLRKTRYMSGFSTSKAEPVKPKESVNHEEDGVKSTPGPTTAPLTTKIGGDKELEDSSPDHRERDEGH